MSRIWTPDKRLLLPNNGQWTNGGGSLSLANKSLAVAYQAGGATPFFSDDFSSGDLTKTQNGFYWEDPGVDTSVISGFGPNGLNNCLEFDYTLSGGSWSEQRFTLGAVYPELWIKWWQFFPLGTESPSRGAKWQRSGAGTGNNKMLRLFSGVHYSETTPRVGSETYLTDLGGTTNCQLYPEAEITGRSGIGPFWDDTPTPTVDPFCNDANRGRWVEIMHAFIKSTNGTSADGYQAIYIDGVLEAVKSDINHVQAVAGVEAGYLMGSFNNAINSKTYIGDIRFYTSNPDA